MQGQPVVLRRTSHKLFQYIISNGRVFSQGLIADDIKKSLHIWETTPTFISYKSVDESTVIAKLGLGKITELYTTKNICKLIVFENNIYVFQIVKCQDCFTISSVCNTDFSTSKIIYKCDKKPELFYVYTQDASIVLFVDNQLLYLSNDLSVTRTLYINNDSYAESYLALQHKYNNLSDEYNQLSCRYGVLQDELRNYKMRT